MISIKQKNTAELKTWYFDKIYHSIEEKRKGPEKAPLQNVPDSFYNGMQEADEEFFRKLLIGSRKEVEQSYTWVKEYGEFCDIVAELKWVRKKQKECKPEDIERCRKKYSSKYVEDAIACVRRSYKRKNIIGIPYNKTQAEKIFHELDQILDAVNGYIAQYINYDMMLDSLIRHELIDRMDIKVCPYCNRILIQTIHYKDNEGEKMIPTADLDHILPQSVYKLFSLSLWNFIPSCKPCNELLKRDKTVRLLSPVERGFEDECIFRLDKIPSNQEGNADVASLLGFGTEIFGKWEVQPETKYEQEIRNNIEVFRLNEQYEYCKQDIKDILRKRYMEEDFYSMLQKYMDKSIPRLTKDEMNRLIYGVSLNPDHFADEPLSKMIYDILMKN